MERVGGRLGSVLADDISAISASLKEARWARMRGLLDSATADAAWESGTRMKLEEAVSYALSDS
jgi:hypothetical protein